MGQRCTRLGMLTEAVCARQEVAVPYLPCAWPAVHYADLVPYFRAASVAGMAAQDLSLPMDWALLRRLTAEGRLHVMGCPGDTWLSREQYEEMHDKVPGLQVSEQRVPSQLESDWRLGCRGMKRARQACTLNRTYAFFP